MLHSEQGGQKKPNGYFSKFFKNPLLTVYNYTIGSREKQWVFMIFLKILRWPDSRQIFTSKTALSYGFSKNDQARGQHFEIPPEK